MYVTFTFPSPQPSPLTDNALAMYTALGKLGYKSYHMTEAMLNANKGSLTTWNEAVEAKYRIRPNSSSVLKSCKRLAPYCPRDFAKLLAGYTATTDIPTVLFLPELMAAYPHAKLILTTHPRGVEAWLRSIRNSFYRVANWAIFDKVLIPYDQAFSRPYMSLVRRTLEIWTDEPWSRARDFEAVEAKLRARYFEHNDTVRSLAREQGREVLEFDPRGGWRPLCEFLGNETPEDEYPRVNEGNWAAHAHVYVVVLRLKAVFGKGLLAVLGALGVLGLAWWMRW